MWKCDSILRLFNKSRPKLKKPFWPKQAAFSQAIQSFVDSIDAMGPLTYHILFAKLGGFLDQCVAKQKIYDYYVHWDRNPVEIEVYFHKEASFLLYTIQLQVD